DMENSTEPATVQTGTSATGGQTLVAHDEAPAQQVRQPSLMDSLPMMVAILAIFYFLLIRPQKKEQDEHKKLLSALKKGDKVVTGSGLHGRIWSVGEHEVSLELSDKVRVTVDKVAVKRRIGSVEGG
ncbi:MAG: preprotein translocase subunit YajC, partial [Myxococcota bacterium]|nr:preprotein translocase subunit YajC [Myxococcota bacterium]